VSILPPAITAPRSRWLFHLFWALGLLAVGSLVLIPGGIVLNQGFGYLLGSFVALPAMAFHGLGWIELGRAIRAIRNDPSSSRAHGSMALAAWASLGSLFVGLLASAVLLPVNFVLVIAFGLFPYYPSVWGPVVTLHAVFLRTTFPVLSMPRVTHAVALGSFGLLAAVAIGIGLFTAFLIWLEPMRALDVALYEALVSIMYVSSGCTFIGYGLAAIGIGVEYKASICSTASGTR